MSKGKLDRDAIFGKNFWIGFTGQRVANSIRSCSDSVRRVWAKSNKYMTTFKNQYIDDTIQVKHKTLDTINNVFSWMVK